MGERVFKNHIFRIRKTVGEKSYYFRGVTYLKIKLEPYRSRSQEGRGNNNLYVKVSFKGEKKERREVETTTPRTSSEGGDGWYTS